ncbi:carbohydrate ABC transporter permease [Streptomyces radicis]|uniref:Carbohydrate ABC transporter permease n=1 Tax=Streptomyces radicis TaxID=1750517 RepID=A0A3A9WIL7_9ACTN|nr:carbohydrate ABC transporter permease [Streptomyces radicis]RKN12153.1 carbohydrate ABC transporter permease [Streptomyces radicis]RKN25794.1 carbohydrate ABC transporter permease [Streptomyces radicis]
MSRIVERVRRVRFTWTHLAALVIALLVAAPLYWMAVSSFKGKDEIGANPPTVFADHPTWDNYREAFADNNFGTYLLNSVLVSVIATILVLSLSSFAGYALARLPLRGKAPIMVALLMISLFPTIALAAPLFLLMRDVGWLNSYQGLIIVYTALNVPFAVWILRNFFLGIPKEMEEVAWVDGASPVRTVLTVILPQARPGMFTAAIFTFTACWTEFLIALTLNTADRYRTMPVGLALFGSQFTVPYGTIFAAATVSVLPIALLVLVFRRAVVSGLTAGAVKG